MSPVLTADDQRECGRNVGILLKGLGHQTESVTSITEFSTRFNDRLIHRNLLRQGFGVSGAAYDDGLVITNLFCYHLLLAMTAESLVTSDPKVLNGTPVFKGTRVPVRTLFEYLADGLSLEYFLESFPSVTREQAADVIRLGQERIEHEVAA